MKVDKENLFAGASYLVSFQQLVEVLTNESATYLNYMSALEKKYKNISVDEKSGLTPIEKKNLVDLVQRVRSLVFNVYVKLNSFEKTKKAKKKDWKELKSNYKKLMDSSFIVNDDVLKDYVINVNTLFVNTISAQTILNSHDVLKAFRSVKT